MNPYQDFLIQHVEQVLEATPDGCRQRVRHRGHKNLDEKNEWVYTDMANMLVMGAYLYTFPDSPYAGSSKLLEFCRSHIDTLVEAAVDCRWYHRESRMGDKNVDRFAGVPFFEAYLMICDDLSAAQRQRVIELADGVWQDQYSQFGSGAVDRENHKFGLRSRDGADQGGRLLYPNMDAYYALLMALCYKVTGNETARKDAERFIRLLDEAQFEDGAWTYIGFANECGIYHAVDLMAMVRAADLLDDDNAWRQLRKSIPYYPMTLTPDGIQEYHTDLWWKHPWTEQHAFAPDIISSLFHDGQNRHFADLSREHTLAHLHETLVAEERGPANAAGFFTVTAARYWRDVTPEAPPAVRLFHDRNIDGPRAHLANWSWAATSRFACDTLVGATARARPNEPLCALMAVTPEIAYRLEGREEYGNQRWALAMVPPGVRGETQIDETSQTAHYTASYRMTACRAFWNFEPHPHLWQCTQQWTMGPSSMVGRIEVRSLEDQYSAPPIVRIRVGLDREFEKIDEGRWRYGPFELELKTLDFVHRRMRKCSPMPVYERDDARELVLYTEQGLSGAQYKADETYEVELTVRIQSVQEAETAINGAAVEQTQ